MLDYTFEMSAMAIARQQKSTTKAGMSFRTSDIRILSVPRHPEDDRL
jgi:hypothetical protein